MQDNNKALYTNKLINESSPYLIQHAHNPVNWYPWNDEILEFAIKNEKLLLISIGYSACHWCHVMEAETFMDEEVALIMNNNFLCIKVDREEHPDIDQLYMEAVQLINGIGGWPLNCFALSDGTPFWGGTYFTKTNWKHILYQIILLNEKTPYKLVEQANYIKNGILENFKSLISNQNIENPIDFEKYYNTISSQLDNVNGGTKNAPKFPMPVFYQYLLHYFYFSNKVELINHIQLTLNEIGKGGIYDQLSGGFSRYSIDENWRVPHFEKMLYDNAELISLYANTFRLENNQFYKNIILSTLTFLEQELQDQNGLNYSALDADSDGVEGKYYTWSKAKINNILKEDSEIFCTYFNIITDGNWENNQNILYVTNNEEFILKKYKLEKTQLYEIIEKSKNILLKARRKRIKPLLDNKIIISWNSIMISALIDVYFAFGEEKYFRSAINRADFIYENYFTNDGKLLRIKDKNGKMIFAFLDDYAFWISALISVYQAGGDEKWLKRAELLVDLCLINFYDEKSGLFFYNANFDNKLFLRNKDIIDNVIPSSNSVLLNSIYLLGIILHNARYKEIVTKSLQLMFLQIEKYPSSYANWIKLLMKINYKFYTILIIGKKAKLFAKEMNSFYLPDTLILHTEKESQLIHFTNKYVEGKTLIYICSESECYQSLDNVKDVIAFIKEKVSL